MMTQHWWFILASWSATIIVFGGLAISALLRHRNARRQLARLEARTRGTA